MVTTMEDNILSTEPTQTIEEYIQDYISFTGETAVYPEAGSASNLAFEYAWLGFISELGELAALVKRQIRDGIDPSAQIPYELGDIAYYMARMEVEGRVELDGFKSQGIPENVRECIDFIESCLELPTILSIFPDTFTDEDVRRFLDLNRDKLLGRKERGTLKGSGDDR